MQGARLSVQTVQRRCWLVWTKTADQILERLAGYCAAINTTA